jgi:2'-5' RNA ligase
MTLKFLGDTRVLKLEKIKKAVREAAGRVGAFNLEITGVVGAFPGTARARVAFIETGQGSSDVSVIYQKLEESLCRIKIRKDKRVFSPHITVARFRDMADISEKAFACRMTPPAVMECREIILYESILKPGGPEYVNMGSFGLK